jgi:hypothetical protein
MKISPENLKDIAQFLNTERGRILMHPLTHKRSTLMILNLQRLSMINPEASYAPFPFQLLDESGNLIPAAVTMPNNARLNSLSHFGQDFLKAVTPGARSAE